MLLNHTINQLRTHGAAPERAQELGNLAYLQWLGALRGNTSYPSQAMRAYTRAVPFAKDCPAIRVFCDLLVESTRTPVRPLQLILPSKQRKGGANGRRAAH